MIKPSQFDFKNQIRLADLDGWYFRKGNDSTWKDTAASLEGWIRLKPVELSKKLADKNGRLEGWFRLDFYLDPGFKDMPLFIKGGTWAATDIFIDGKYLTSFGSTGLFGQPYHEFGQYMSFPISVNMEAGIEHSIALHIVDKISPLPTFKLKSEYSDEGLKSLIQLAGPTAVWDSILLIRETSIYTTIWISICTVLSLLFWLFVIQNRKEKSFLLIAVCVSCLAMNIFILTKISFADGISFLKFTLTVYVANLFSSIDNFLMPLILVSIFKIKVSTWLRIYFILFLLLLLANIIFTNPAVQSGLQAINMITCLLFVIVKWRQLKGAQWAIAWGVTICVGWIAVFTYHILKYQTVFFPHSMLFITGIFLSFPLGLLFYVALRYKEMIREVKQHSLEVLKLSEEKKDQALQQQGILQKEVDRQTAELRNTIDNLKTTQAQLIQSEKMASLGELTAGIAHEIQNPLNFVNNFSEVNMELIEEMSTKLEMEEWQEALEISRDVKNNQAKIMHHGKRADSIVKNMLLHSRASSGIKEMVDMNALTDEYLRLAFHGLRAKDKSFNATVETEFDKDLPKLNVVPQEIGRVLLNIINNALFAVNEKRRSLTGNYHPTIKVSSALNGDKVMIKVTDNGGGIPDAIKEKIFQPFFTTKTTGQGTGLGLSLSYDIIKAHGGEISFETKEGLYSTFTVKLPI